MQPTVLVAETDRTSLELVSAVLTREGFSVLATPDGGDALARFHEANPTVVVCARDLPGLSGEELCRQIKAQGSETRVVLLDSGIDAGELTSATGCDAVLARPFRYPQLKTLLAEWGVIEAGPAPVKPEVGFGVPAPQPFNFAAPAAVAPPSFDALQPVAPPAPDAVAPPAEADVAPVDALSVPPLSVPIPLPTPQQAPMIDDDIPDLDLDAVAQSTTPMESPPAPEMPFAPAPGESRPAPETPFAVAPAQQQPAPEMPFAAAPTSLEPEEEIPELVPEPLVEPEALSVPLEGDLTVSPLPRLLYELYISTFSGVVRLTRGDTERAVYIRGGLPVRVDSHQMSEMLGRILVDHGRITMDQYTESLQVMQDKSLRQGEALVSIGAIREAELLEALQEQTALKLANSFAWRDGRYKIEPDESFADASVISELSALQAIWRGVHEHYDLESLLTYFTPLRARYAVAGDLFAVHYDTLGPFVRELKLLELLNGTTTFEAALNQGERTLRVAQAFYVLMVTEMVAASETPGQAAVEPDASAPAAMPAVSAAAAPTPAAPSAALPTLDPDAVQRLADDIAAEYLRFKDSDYFDALRLDPSCSVEEVDFAYQNVVRSLRLEELPSNLPADASKRAEEIRAILAKARAVLRDPQQRDRYLSGQQSQFSSAPEPVSETMASEEPAPVPGKIASLEVDLAGDGHASILAQQAYLDGMGFMDTELWKEAAGKFQAAIASDAREPSYRVALGRAIMMAEGTTNEHSRRKIATCLQQALQLDPSHEEGNLEMAKLLAATGHKDRAYPYVQRVLQRAPANAEARQLLAELG